MKKFLPFFTLFCVIFAFQNVNAQNPPIQFEYDAAGNCVLKYKTVRLNAPKNQSNSEDTSQSSTDSVSIEDMIGAIKIFISPNPTKGLLKIDFQNKSTETVVNYTLTEMNGRQILSGKSADNPLMLDLSGFQTGVYLLRINVNGKTETYKIIKE